MQAVFLHTIDDVKHCLKHRLHKDAKLFSANVNVVYYLRHKCGIVCQDLCSYLNPQEIQVLRETTLRSNSSLVRELDQRIAPELNRQLGLDIRYFDPLYLFVGARQLFIYMSMACCFRQMLDRFSIDSILVYEGNLGPLKSSIRTFLAQAFPAIDVRIVDYSSPVQNSKILIRGYDINEIERLVYQYIHHDFQDKVLKQQGKSKNNILVFEPMYGSLEVLEFLTRQTGEKSVYCFKPSIFANDSSYEYEIGSHFFPDSDSLKSIYLAQEDMKVMLLLLYKSISNAFCKNIVKYLSILLFYKKLHEDTPIQSAYWEIPPHFQEVGALALVLEYFMTNQRTEVVGVQARATYLVGQRANPYTFVGIFNRCHYYLTQGFRSEDIDILHPNNLKKASIISPNIVVDMNIEQTVSFPKRKMVDVAIYITPTSSFLQTGQIDSNVEIQAAWLGLLNDKIEKNIHVVTYGKPTFENCAMLSLLETLHNITIVKDVEMHNYFTQYAPQIVLMDVPTKFLIDVFPEDTTIILMKGDSQFELREAVDLLKKRVHYAETLEEAKHLLQMFFEGKLDKKQDNTYIRKFCNQEGLKEKLLQRIGGS
ncbi:hypothetical protein [Anaerospora hongkongensis]|uniref:hypothetical protein n=1 Tax=Anaerospora hongkongensis TaxID=244830 RepID=UPI00289DE6A1|nr:hypothetical protein [Anaerospora hongkongensis]